MNGPYISGPWHNAEPESPIARWCGLGHLLRYLMLSHNGNQKYRRQCQETALAESTLPRHTTMAETSPPPHPNGGDGHQKVHDEAKAPRHQPNAVAKAGLAQQVIKATDKLSMHKVRNTPTSVNRPNRVLKIGRLEVPFGTMQNLHVVTTHQKSVPAAGRAHPHFFHSSRLSLSKTHA